jgi:Na+/melibiose symporter-like transporter
MFLLFWLALRRVMSQIENERTKLTAALFNSLAAAVVAAGLFAPVAALAYGISNPKIGLIYFGSVILVCVGVGASLHLIGRFILRRLQE